MSCQPLDTSIVTYDFPKHRRGNTYDGTVFTVTLNGVARDLTGASIKMSLKTGKDVTASVLDLTTANGKITIDSPNTLGKFRVPPQIITVPPAIYFYDIQITFSDLTVKTYVEGRWQIIQNVTV